VKLEEVLPAMRAGKKIRFNWCGFVSTFASFAELFQHSPESEILESDGWSIVEEPATDEELAAAFEAKAEEVATSNPAIFWRTENMLRLAADMVRKRYVDPGWKVGGGK
jgi:hypothetical protein